MDFRDTKSEINVNKKTGIWADEIGRNVCPRQVSGCREWECTATDCVAIVKNLTGLANCPIISREWMRAWTNKNWPQSHPCAWLVWNWHQVSAGHATYKIEKIDKGCLMTRMAVSGWMFLLVSAHPGSSGQRAVKRLCVCCQYSCWLLAQYLCPYILRLHSKKWMLAFSQSTVVHPLSLIPATKNDRLAMHNLQFNSNSILRKTVIAITTTIFHCPLFQDNPGKPVPER